MTTLTDTKEHGGGLVSSRDPLFADVNDWLTREAWVLDENRFDEWLDMLSEELDYRAPIRKSVMREDGDGVDRSFGHFEETYGSMKVRINRVLRTPSAWSEDPPSRTRRFVTNVRVREADADGRIAVVSYLLLLRSRWDMPEFEFISCERRDVFDVDPVSDFKLRSREIVFDQASLGTVNLGLFL